MEKELSDLVDVDSPDLEPITEETRRSAIETSQSGGYLPYRLATGRFWTDREYEKYQKKVLSGPKNGPISKIINNIRLWFSYY